MSKFTDNQLKELLLKGYTVDSCAQAFKVDVSCVYKRKKKLHKQGWNSDLQVDYDLRGGEAIRGVSTLVDGDGNVKAQWIKTNQDKKQQLEILKTNISKFVDDLPVFKPTKTKTKKGDLYSKELMAVYPLGDPHIGMLAWGEESGADWDLAIAEKYFCSIFDRAVKTAPRCQQAVIVNLGDYFHYDNMAGVTSRSGNSLEVDGRYAKMVAVGLKIIRQMITSALEHHKTVKVINAIGNHDDVSSLFLSLCLQHVYEKEKRVIIDSSPTPFHYIKFGMNLIGVHHGHSCKLPMLPGVMASDRAKEWGETEFRYWLTGHIHHDTKKEFPGVTVESFRTLAAKDAYATHGGYRSGQDTKCLVYHTDYGEVERHTVNIKQEQ